MKRRGFLQQAGWILAALGTNEAGFAALGNRATQVLAQPTQRKLALLVGIDRYVDVAYGNNGVPLAGCATDVALQRELLIHRFGFQPSDILTLTNERATRSQIETAFIAHLREQAQPGDVVVFHFSGYGSRIQLPDDPARTQNSLVPVDGVLAVKGSIAVNDLPEETLWLMLRSLPTSNVLTVLDTSYTYPGSGFQGNLRIRSRPNPTLGEMGDGELAFQAKLRRDSNFLSRFSSQRKLPGIAISAVNPNELAMEAQWSGFSAGVLTYALTQQLWQMTSSPMLRAISNRAAFGIEQLAGNEQHPQICKGTAPPCEEEVQDGKDALFPLQSPIPGAEGVVLSVEEDGQDGRVWLAGLPPWVLEAYGVNSILSATGTGDTDAPAVLLQVRAKEGLAAKVQALEIPENSTFQVGQLVRESVRAIPRDRGLIVALDSTLERIERVDATSAFSAIRNVSTVALGETADCLFGRVRRATIASAPEADLPTLPDRGGYGLYSLGHEPILSSLSEGDEAIKTAIQRLIPQLNTLRADKRLASTTNENSSGLGVGVELALVEPESRVVAQTQTLTGKGSYGSQTSLSFNNSSIGAIATVPAGSRIQYRLHNFSNRPTYFILFGLDSSGRAIAFNLSTLSTDPAQTRTYPSIEPGQTLILPSASESWKVSPLGGANKTYVLFSYSPFEATFAALLETLPSKALDLQVLSDPLVISEAILEDLHQASLPKTKTLRLPKDAFALDVGVWATLSLMYRAL
ncbi:MAG: caspase family protein [Cyanobacteriota bacterium]|nr:caspase family protein [Cyanobacteriota bacterium]